MKILLIIPLLFLSYYIIPEKAFTQEELHILGKLVIQTPKPLTVKEIIQVKGAEYGVSIPLMEKIIWCESHGSTTIQSTHIYTSNKYGLKGTRELSFGPAQWHIPAGNKKKDGTVITKEDALNPEIAIDTMAWYISQGKAHLWSCYNKVI